MSSRPLPARPWWRLLSGACHPAQVVVFAFVAATLMGTTLLMLPTASEPGSATGAVPALFTAVFAICVTDLVVVDTPTHWSMFGEVVVLSPRTGQPPGLGGADATEALVRYQERMRPPVIRRQELGRRFTEWTAPSSRWRIVLHDWMFRSADLPFIHTRILASVPPPTGDVLDRPHPGRASF